MKTKLIQDGDALAKVRSDSVRFLWHLPSRRKYPLQFSHEHWWAGEEEKVPLEAAIWELMRRHPDADDAHRKVSNPNLETVLDPVTTIVGCHCFKTWRGLSKWEQCAFVRGIWKQLPSRHGFLAPPVTVLNDHRPFHKHQQALRKPGVEVRLATHLKRLEQQLISSAKEYHLAGKILVAIDPAAPISRITKGVESAVTHWREGQEPKKVGKARVGQWLVVVANFEKGELARALNQKRSDQLFAQYRRTIEDWKWIS